MSSVYVFQRGKFKAGRLNSPLCCCAFARGVVVGFADGSIRIYHRSNGIYSPVTAIYSYNSSLRHQNRLPGVSALAVTSEPAVEGSQDVLFAAYHDGTLVKYLVDGGQQLEAQKLSFTCTAITNWNQDRIILTGSSSEILVVDKKKMSLVAHLTDLKEWPFVLPMQENSDTLVIVLKSGLISRWTVSNGIYLDNDLTSANIESCDNAIAKSVSSEGPIVSATTVQRNAYLVATTKSWYLFAYEDNQLVVNVSSPLLSPVSQVVAKKSSSEPKSESENFSFVDTNENVTLCADGNVQILEPSWDTSRQHVIGCYYSSEADQLRAVVADKSNLSIFSANLLNESKIEWNPTLQVLDELSDTQTISGVTGDKIIELSGHHLYSYSLSEFLSARHDYKQPLHSLKKGRFTSISSSTDSLLIVGTSTGTVIFADLESENLKISEIKIFAGEVSILARARQNSSFLAAVSSNNTLAIVDLNNRSNFEIIPGNNVDVTEIYCNLGWPLVVKICYEDGGERVWNLESGELVEEEGVSGPPMFQLYGENVEPWSDTLLIPLPLRKLRQSRAPLLMLNMTYFIESIEQEMELGQKPKIETFNEVRAIVNALFKISGTNLLPWQKSLLLPTEDGVEPPKICVGLASYSSTFISMGLTDPTALLTLNPRLTSRLVSVWAALIRLYYMADHVNNVDLNSLYLWTCRTVPNLQLSALSAVDTEASFVNETAHLLLRQLLSVRVKDQSSLEKIVMQWKPLLGVFKTGDIYDATCIEALDILYLVSECYSKTAVRPSKLMISVHRAIAETLQIYLLPDSPDEVLEKTFEIVGKGWSLWEKYFNPLDIIATLIRILYMNGFMKPVGTGTSSPVAGNHSDAGSGSRSFLATKGSGGRKSRTCLLCQRCIRDIAARNITMLVSVLVMQVNKQDLPLDARVTSIRLLSNLIVSTTTLSPGHLSVIVSAVVKVLNLQNPSTLQLSAYGNVSLSKEASKLLSSAMIRYPEHIAFSKPQQQLATSNPVNAGPNVVGVIYDLKTGAVCSYLAYNQEPKNVSYSLMTPMFSADGKKIAGLLVLDNDTKLVSWKLTPGLFSLFGTAHATNGKDSEPVFTPCEVKDVEWKQNVSTTIVWNAKGEASLVTV